MQVKEIIKYLDTRNGISINDSYHFRSIEDLMSSAFIYDKVDKVSIGRNGSLTIITKKSDGKTRYVVNGVIISNSDEDFTIKNTFSICTPLVDTVEKGIDYVNECVNKMHIGQNKVIITGVEEYGNVAE